MFRWCSTTRPSLRRCAGSPTRLKEDGVKKDDDEYEHLEDIVNMIMNCNNNQSGKEHEQLVNMSKTVKYLAHVHQPGKVVHQHHNHLDA